jgi:hypothetical protein
MPSIGERRFHEGRGVLGDFGLAVAGILGSSSGQLVVGLLERSLGSELGRLGFLQFFVFHVAVTSIGACLPGAVSRRLEQLQNLATGPGCCHQVDRAATGDALNDRTLLAFCLTANGLAIGAD